MPIIKSAKKRVKQAAKRQIRNYKFRRRLHDIKKDFEDAIKAKDAKKATEMLPQMHSILDTCDKKNLIHANKAARLKSQAQKRLDSLTTKAK